mgnify:CR=1 FL=1
MAKTGQRLDRQRYGRGGQAAAVTRGECDHLGAMFRVMHQQARGFATRRQIGFGQNADAVQRVVQRRRIITDRPGRAQRRTGPATGTDQRVDCDMVAVGADRTGRTDVEAAGTTGLPRARMGAQMRLQHQMQRLFWLA